MCVKLLPSTMHVVSSSTNLRCNILKMSSNLNINILLLHLTNWECVQLESFFLFNNIIIIVNFGRALFIRSSFNSMRIYLLMNFYSRNIHHHHHHCIFNKRKKKGRSKKLLGTDKRFIKRSKLWSIQRGHNVKDGTKFKFTYRSK